MNLSVVTETIIAISPMTSGLFRLPNRVRCLTLQGWIVLLTLWGISNENLFAQAPVLEVSQPVRHFLETTCFSCHGEEKQKGKVRLDTLAPALGDPASAQLWQDVLDVINKGDMPPPEEKYDQAALAEAVGLLTEDLLKARKLLSDRGGEVVTRRLTELEYINTLRVLTGVTVPESLVPDDESGTDFNTLGRYQTFSPAMLEQYEEAARYAIGQLLAVPKNRERKVIREDGTKNMRQQKQREWDKHNEQYQRAMSVMRSLWNAPIGFFKKADA